MTDQRNRLTTDPGLGPIESEHPSTLRSIAAARPIAPDDEFGAPVYYEPKPLHAVSDHKTLELETVKLSEDIDPRKLPTELKLRRPVLHVVPGSDPNWQAPAPAFDSGWPPPETVVTTSQRPLPARRRSYIPLVAFVLCCVTLLLVLGANARRRSTAAVAGQRKQGAPAVTSPKQLETVRGMSPASANRPPPRSAVVASAPAAPAAHAVSAPEAARSASASASIAELEASASATGAAPATSGSPATSAASARFADAPHRSGTKPLAASASTSTSTASDRAPDALPATKPKRAIY